MPLRHSGFGNQNAFPSSGHINSQQRLPGLTIQETIEFEELDTLPPFDDNGEVAWKFEGQRRWLELYTIITSSRN